jgi:50S ribosomal protein L16 3-hydroxylase
LLLPGALTTDAPCIDPDELAWLATLPDVESRLVFTERNGGQSSYRVEHGPFAENQLTKLPASDWTLLVQDVEKHLPTLRSRFAPFAFVPDWRIDDLMVSVAAPGGSVGPHRDNYDVFLCQGSGTRLWRLGDADNVENDPQSTALSLLKPFETAQEYSARQGDVLYLPAGVPHWGIAEDLCVTYSIGMRAPNQAELYATGKRLFPNLAEAGQRADALRFYADPDLHPDEAIAGLISNAAIRRVRDQGLLPASCSEAQGAIVLGVLATDPKAWLEPELLSRRDATNWLAANRGISVAVHGMARLAFTDLEDASYFFANGFYLPLQSQNREPVISLCAKRTLQLPANASLDGYFAELLEWMAMHGVFDTDTQFVE